MEQEQVLDLITANTLLENILGKDEVNAFERFDYKGIAHPVINLSAFKRNKNIIEIEGTYCHSYYDHSVNVQSYFAHLKPANTYG
jgi:hypothetical protein